MADIDSERELVTIQSFRELPEAMLAKGCLIRLASNASWWTITQAICWEPERKE